jgi:polyribonucleotide nucleotidyltransferase
MEPVISEPRAELSKWAPKIIQMNIDPEKIGDVVGQRGKTINALIEKYDVSIDIEDDGFVSISGTDNEKMRAAQEAIKLIVTEFEKDMVLTGKVVSIKEFGAFLEFAPGKEGLVHISKIANTRIARVEDVLQLGDVVRVICLGKDKNGKFSFSIKDCPKDGASSRDVGKVVASADPE